ncbi:MAG: hypothetical protein RSF67_08965, partial [Clostridia bacterium]
IVLILALFTTACVSTNKDSRILTDEEWLEDITYLEKSILKDHPSPFEYVSETKWNEKVTKLKEDLTNLSDTEVIFRIHEIVSSMNDVHTYIKGTSSISPETKKVEKLVESSHFPIKFIWVGDELVVSSLPKEHEKLLESKVISINNYKIEEVLKKLFTIVKHDNNQTARNSSLVYISSYDALEYLGVVDGKHAVKYVLQNESGVHTISLEPKIMENSKDEMVFIQDENLPENLKKPDNASDFYWVKPIEEDNAIYFKFNICDGKEFSTHQSLDNNEFPSFFEVVDEIIELSSSGNYDKFIIDLRSNGGGSAALVSYLLAKIEGETDIKEKYTTYVVTGNQTISAAAFSVVDIVNHLNATVVGEETGGNVNIFAYSSVTDETILPNSGITLMISQVETEKIPGYKGGYKPDVEIKQSYKNYINRVDDCYEFIKSDK